MLKFDINIWLMGQCLENTYLIFKKIVQDSFKSVLVLRFCLLCPHLYVLKLRCVEHEPISLSLFIFYLPDYNLWAICPFMREKWYRCVITCHSIILLDIPLSFIHVFLWSHRKRSFLSSIVFGRFFIYYSFALCYSQFSNFGC